MFGRMIRFNSLHQRLTLLAPAASAPSPVVRAYLCQFARTRWLLGPGSIAAHTRSLHTHTLLGHAHRDRVEYEHRGLGQLDDLDASDDLDEPNSLDAFDDQDAFDDLDDFDETIQWAIEMTGLGVAELMEDGIDGFWILVNQLREAERRMMEEMEEMEEIEEELEEEMEKMVERMVEERVKVKGQVGGDYEGLLMGKGESAKGGKSAKEGKSAKKEKSKKKGRFAKKTWPVTFTKSTEFTRKEKSAKEEGSLVEKKRVKVIVNSDTKSEVEGVPQRRNQAVPPKTQKTVRESERVHKVPPSAARDTKTAKQAPSLLDRDRAPMGRECLEQPAAKLADLDPLRSRQGLGSNSPTGRPTTARTGTDPYKPGASSKPGGPTSRRGLSSRASPPAATP